MEKWLGLVRFRKAVNAHSAEMSRLQGLLHEAKVRASSSNIVHYYIFQLIYFGAELIRNTLLVSPFALALLRRRKLAYRSGMVALFFSKLLVEDNRGHMDKLPMLCQVNKHATGDVIF